MALPELWYSLHGRRNRLPAWAVSLVRLGAEAVRSARTENGERLIAAIAVPTRAYAATLAAVGAVAASEPLSAMPGGYSIEALEAHFRQLAVLRPGTTVTVSSASGGVARVGTFAGVEENSGEPVLVIQQRDFTQKIEKRSCYRVTVRGRSLACVLVGRANVLEEEITSGDVVTSSSRPLQDILKAGRFLGRRQAGMRSEVLPQGVDLPQELRDAQPALVIFDGAGALRRWREGWRDSGWIIILDRTSPQFAEGVGLVEEEYVQRATSSADPQLELPANAELMAFWSSR
jgi:hypothetical protein